MSPAGMDRQQERQIGKTHRNRMVASNMSHHSHVTIDPSHQPSVRHQFTWWDGLPHLVTGPFQY